MKRHLTTIVLLVAVAGLILFLVLDRDHGTTGEQKAREKNVFPIWRKDDVRKLTIQHDNETVVLEKQGAAWTLGGQPADEAAVERLLGSMENATIARRATDAPGLDAPRASGSVTMGGLTTRFALGGDSPRPEGSAYFRVDDGGSLVIGRDLVQVLLQPADTYRDRTVVPYLATELSRFEVKGRFVLERIDERALKVNGVVASRAAVDQLWAALAEMRAESFPKADIDKPVLTIVLTPKDGRPASEIAIGDACPNEPNDVVVVRKTPSRVVACAPKDIVERLSPSDDVLLEKHPFTLHADEMEELVLERGASKIEIARKGTGFHQRAPDDRELTGLEAEAASGLLERLAKTEAASVLRGGSAFAAVARARVTSGEHDETIELAAPDAQGHVMLRRTLDDARLEATPALVRLLTPRATTLRPPQIVENEDRRAKSLSLRCGVEQDLVDQGNGFRYVTPKGYEADGSIVQLVEAIVKGKVEPWVADEDDGSFGLADRACHVTVGFEDGTPLTVWLGAAGEGGVYGRTSARAGVFVAPLALRELFARLYVSRAAPHTNAAQIESVRITEGGRTSTDSALRDAVGALYADRVVALGTKAAGAPDLVIELGLAEGGPPKRIACAAAKDAERLCTVSGVDATFALAVSRFATLERDAGAR